MTPRQRLAHELRIRWKLPPGRPTDEEVDLILQDVAQAEARHSRQLTPAEWQALTLERVRFTGDYIYKGLNFQDLNALLAAVRAEARAAKK